jgi:hypothetical protein
VGSSAGGGFQFLENFPIALNDLFGGVTACSLRGYRGEGEDRRNRPFGVDRRIIVRCRHQIFSFHCVTTANGVGGNVTCRYTWQQPKHLKIIFAAPQNEDEEMMTWDEFALDYPNLHEFVTEPYSVLLVLIFLAQRHDDRHRCRVIASVGFAWIAVKLARHAEFAKWDIWQLMLMTYFAVSFTLQFFAAEK